MYYPAFHDVKDWANTPIDERTLALVGNETWDCDGEPLTPTMRGQIISRLAKVYETGLQWRIEDFGDAAKLTDFLREEATPEDPYAKLPFLIDHGNEVAEWVEDYLHFVWMLKVDEENVNPSVLSALGLLDDWYESFLIKDVLDLLAPQAT